MTVDTSAKPKIGRGEELRVTVIVRDYQNASAPKVKNSPVIMKGDDMDCIAYSEQAPVDSSTSTVRGRRGGTV